MLTFLSSKNQLIYKVSLSSALSDVFSWLSKVIPKNTTPWRWQRHPVFFCCFFFLSGILLLNCFMVPLTVISWLKWHFPDSEHRVAIFLTIINNSRKDTIDHACDSDFVCTFLLRILYLNITCFDEIPPHSLSVILLLLSHYFSLPVSCILHFKPIEHT